MKIKVTNKSLKNAISRVSSLVEKKSSIPALTGVLVKAADGKVTLSATNLDTYITVDLADSEIIEDGDVVITLSAMDKILMVKDVITIRSENEAKDNVIVTANNDKKKSKIRGISGKEFIEMPTMDQTTENLVMTIPNGAEFCEDMKIIGQAKSDNSAKPIYTGFNFNSQNRAICAIDGYRMIFKTVDWWSENLTNTTISGRTDKELAKIIGKDKHSIKMYHNKKYAAFVGEDFVYLSRLFDGQFIDCKNILPSDNAMVTDKTEFTFTDTKAVLSMLKEYVKANKTQQTYLPCVFTGYSEGNALTRYSSSDYKTFDEVGIDGTIADDLVIGFNPDYFHTALNLFNKLGIDYKVRMYSSIKPIVITGGDYTSVVVPMRCEPILTKDYLIKDYAA